jgi:hypothetical protein
MDSIRFAGLVVVAFALSFAGVFWLVVPHSLNPAALLPSWHVVDADTRHPREQGSNAADSEQARDKLRNAVIEAADDLRREPCNDAMKARYIAAATKYARAWLSIAPCVGTQSCGSSDGPRLDRAQQAFGTPLDRQAREAMQKAHETGALKEGDFASDAVIMVATFARDPGINPHADPKIKKLTLEMRSERGCRAYER